MRRLLPAAAVIVAVALPLSADPRRCIDAHEQGQVLRNQSKLLEARQRFASCSSDGNCPPIVAAECATFLGEVDRDLPSLVFSATGLEGSDADDVSVYVDGRLVAERLDGRATPVDPGRRALRFVAARGTQRTLSIVVAQGQKNVPVAADFRAPGVESELQPEPDSRQVPAASFVLGAIGVVALGSFAYFGLSGKSQEACKPYCTQDEADAMRRSYLAADVSLGVAVLSLGAAFWIALDQTSGKSSASSGWKLGARAAKGAASVGLTAGF
jgi:hypothetical protein